MKSFINSLNRERVASLIFSFSTVFFIFNAADLINSHMSFKASANAGVDLNYPIIRMLLIYLAAYLVCLAVAMAVRKPDN